MSIKRMWFVLALLMIIDNCDCVLNIERALEKPSIRPLNLKARTQDTTVFVYGRFQCPDDTYVDIDYGTIVKFQKVLDSTKNSTDFELVLYHDSGMHSKLTLRSKSSLESLVIYLNDKADKSVQTGHFGTKCEVGISSLSDHNSNLHCIY
ncbi:uncharacterized protein LOC134245441 [Saccostrea cucullata]|uniref:uncharacterized protein LOC134245441 n=1 Tax=Saccostrea cuccullata TaxID=36930 RepID=UPI002ED17D89